MSDSSVSSSDDEEVAAKKVFKSDLFTKKGVTLVDQQNAIKDEFKRQAGMAEVSDSDDLLVKKKVQREDSEEEYVPKKEKKREAKLVTDKELLARFYGQENELTQEDKFLRNYILNEGWKEGSG
jgi:protein KRI1